jgi:hypothetical protein
MKQMAGNIIPAIATTNAVVAGLCRMRARGLGFFPARSAFRLRPSCSLAAASTSKKLFSCRLLLAGSNFAGYDDDYDRTDPYGEDKLHSGFSEQDFAHGDDAHSIQQSPSIEVRDGGWE